MAFDERDAVEALRSGPEPTSAWESAAGACVFRSAAPEAASSRGSDAIVVAMVLHQSKYRATRTFFGITEKTVQRLSDRRRLDGSARMPPMAHVKYRLRRVRYSRGRTAPARLVLRSKIVRRTADDLTRQAIAEDLDIGH